MENDEKDSLQLRKLALEIAELERPWWKRPTYILAALPTLLAVVALTVGFLNGFFSAQLTKLENQRHDIESQIREFEGTRNTLVTQNQKLQNDISTKQNALIEINDIASKLRGVLINLQLYGPSAGPVKVEQELKAAAEFRRQTSSELLDALSKLNELLTNAGIDTKPKPAYADILPTTNGIRVDSKPATEPLPKRRKMKKRHYLQHTT